VARQVQLVEAEADHVVVETKELLTDEVPAQKALRLAELGVGTPVCGAISWSFHEMIAANAIRVIPFVAGDLREVSHACAYAAPYVGHDPEMQKQTLKNEADALQSELDFVKRRQGEIESKTAAR
jgi:hypothetical protein